MNSFKRIFGIFLSVVIFTIAAGAADACPSCKDAFSKEATTSQETMGGATKGKGGTSVKQASVGTSYSVSILLMLGMPMAVVGGIGYIIYKQSKRGKKLQLEARTLTH